MNRSSLAYASLLLALAARRAYAAADGPSPPRDFQDRSGLSELVFWQGVNGLFAGGLLADAVTGGQIEAQCQTTSGPNNEYSKPCKDALARAGGIGALALAAGIATPLLVTRGRDVRTADAVLINRATLVGAMHGYIIPFASGLDSVKGNERRVLSALAFTGDLLGVGVGAYLAHRFDLTPGQVSFVGTLHTTTFLAALSVGNSMPREVHQREERSITAVSLGLADVALGLGIASLDRIDIGRHRVFWLDTGALVGWMGGGGLGAIIGGSSKRAAAIGSTIGLATGIALTYWATSGTEGWRRRYQPGQGTLRFEPPTVRIAPDEATAAGTLVSIDALRGSF